MQVVNANNAISAPRNWFKFGEIYNDDKYRTIFVCSVCSGVVHSFGDVTSLWDHIAETHPNELIHQGNCVKSQSSPPPTPHDDAIDTEVVRIDLDAFDANVVKYGSAITECSRRGKASALNVNSEQVQNTVHEIICIDSDSDDEEDYVRMITKELSDLQPKYVTDSETPLVTIIKEQLQQQQIQQKQQEPQQQEQQAHQTCTTTFYENLTDENQQNAFLNKRNLLFDALPEVSTPCRKRNKAAIHVEATESPAQRFPTPSSPETYLPPSANHAVNISQAEDTCVTDIPRHINARGTPQGTSTSTPLHQSQHITVQTDGLRLHQRTNTARQHNDLTVSQHNNDTGRVSHTAKRVTGTVTENQCEICGIRSHLNVTYLRHKVRYHTEGVNITNVRCDICCELMLRKDFKRHYAQHRSKSQLHLCPLCRVYYRRKDTLLLHLVKCHSIFDVFQVQRMELPHSLPTPPPSLSSDSHFNIFPNNNNTYK